MDARLLPLSAFPATPFSFQVPEERVVAVSDEGADAGIPVSKVSLICAESKPVIKKSNKKVVILFIAFKFWFDFNTIGILGHNRKAQLKNSLILVG